jgi:hypothetical protein
VCLCTVQAIRIGGRVLVVTNDEMRDHHFQMLSHRRYIQTSYKASSYYCHTMWIMNTLHVGNMCLLALLFTYECAMLDVHAVAGH